MIYFTDYGTAGVGDDVAPATLPSSQPEPGWVTPVVWIKYEGGKAAIGLASEWLGPRR